jgi:hypothetical protein
MQNVFCKACGIGMDVDDNFCRRCGATADASALPAVRRQALPAVWRPAVTPAMKGAAVMAAGTVGQFLLRRAVNGIISGGSSGRPRTFRIGRPKERDGLADEAQIITETVMMRRVRIRRPT